MNPSLCTKLSLPADERFLPMVLAHIREIGRVALLPNEDSIGLELAVKEAFTNIIKYSYPDCQPGDVFFDTEIKPMELILSIKDEGLPYDPLQEKNIDLTTKEKEMPLHEFGFEIVRHKVDEIHFENLGRNGKALRMVKRLPRPVEIQSERVTKETEMAPRQNYKIRPMRPDDAFQVSKLFWLVYGYSYVYTAIYKPEDLIHMVESGHTINYVAAAENGEVVGHIGLILSGQVAEVAFAAVAPAHRKHGLFDSLMVAIEAKALELGLRGLYANPVTSHAISQKEVMRHGYKPCGLELAAGSPIQFKAITKEDSIPQRESRMNCFKYLSQPLPVVANVSPRHRDMVSRIYENLGKPFQLGDPKPSTLQGNYKISFDKNLQSGLISVISADMNQWLVILRAIEDLEKFGRVEVVNIDLPLAQPASALICELAEKAGFFFSGIWPREAQEGDYLRLQRLTAPLDMSRLCVYSDFGKDLFEYVQAQMAHVGRQ